jgi:DNA primase
MTLHDLIKINKIALRYFVDSLQRHQDVYRYLRGRLSAACIERFKLGYAPHSGLIDRLNTHDVPTEDVEALGLIGLNEDGSAYEVFCNRVIIPIVHAGMLVGFGGRRMDADTSKVKYLNSKASILYTKGTVLYGLWHSRASIRKEGFAIIEEGYFDWLSCFDAGITNVVATCGTALTEDHCTMLKRYTKNIGVMLDGDDAGVKMAKKMVEVAREHGLSAKAIALPSGFDPDEYLAHYGKEKVLKLIAHVMR